MLGDYKCNHFYESRTTSPRSRPNKIGWFDTHENHKKSIWSSKSNAIFIGDSIIKNLCYYKDIWNGYFGNKGFTNCGIGGDHIENVLWRVKNLDFPNTVSFVLLQCGTNNLAKDSPIDIVNGILSIGVNILDRFEKISVLITGILPRESKTSSKRSIIDYVNSRL